MIHRLQKEKETTAVNGAECIFRKDGNELPREQ